MQVPVVIFILAMVPPNIEGGIVLFLIEGPLFILRCVLIMLDVRLMDCFVIVASLYLEAGDGPLSYDSASAKPLLESQTTQRHAYRQ